MKKIIFAIAIVLTMGLSAGAQQNDAYFTDWGSNDFRNAITPTLPGGVVGALVGNITANESPVGSGLLVLTALGAGYVVARKRKNK